MKRTEYNDVANYKIQLSLQGESKVLITLYRCHTSISWRTRLSNPIIFRWRGNCLGIHGGNVKSARPSPPSPLIIRRILSQEVVLSMTSYLNGCFGNDCIYWDASPVTSTKPSQSSQKPPVSMLAESHLPECKDLKTSV